MGLRSPCSACAANACVCYFLQVYIINLEIIAQSIVYRLEKFNPTTLPPHPPATKEYASLVGTVVVVWLSFVTMCFVWLMAVALGVPWAALIEDSYLSPRLRAATRCAEMVEMGRLDLDGPTATTMPTNPMVMAFYAKWVPPRPAGITRMPPVSSDTSDTLMRNKDRAERAEAEVALAAEAGEEERERTALKLNKEESGLVPEADTEATAKAEVVVAAAKAKAEAAEEKERAGVAKAKEVALKQADFAKKEEAY